jgi:hypothetical protein
MKTTTTSVEVFVCWTSYFLLMLYCSTRTSTHCDLMTKGKTGDESFPEIKL